MQRGVFLCAVVMGTGSASGETVQTRLDIDMSSSSAMITYGLDIFQPMPTFAADLNSPITGFIDLELEMDGDQVMGATVMGAELATDPLLSADLDAGMLSGSATLENLKLILNSPVQLKAPFPANANGDKTNFNNFGEDGGDFDLEGNLNVDLGGFLLDPIDLSEQQVDNFDLFGIIGFDGENVFLGVDFFFMGGDFSDPVFPGSGSNLAYFGQGTVFAAGRIPAPGVASVFGLGGLLSLRRRR